jgi:hypothetical protein
MNVNKFLQSSLVLYFLFYLSVHAQTWEVNPDYWTATDNLGRTTPTENQTGAVRSGKYVGIFYLTWHTDNIADFSPVLNITQILNQYPNAANELNNPAWKGIINGGVFWWDEPLFGYYRTTDEWVLRKHAQMLADAGIDVVFLDCTNGSQTYKSAWTKLLKVWDQARRDGVKTPQIAFLLPFAPTDGGLYSIKELYNNIYKPGLSKNLWFMWNGKPLIMAYTEMLTDLPGNPAETQLRHDIKNFFTFRPGQPDYVSGPTRNDQWGWLEDYPQHGFVNKAGGGYEEVTVGVAQNASGASLMNPLVQQLLPQAAVQTASTGSSGHASAFNEPTTYGRSYTKAYGQNPDTNAYLYGYNIQEQWGRAFQLDPDLVFVTGWDEWIAGRWDTVSWPNPYAPFSFVDQYSREKSRDIEPVKSWGDNGDNYYIQLVGNVRKFKGMQSQEPRSNPQTISLDNMNEWNDVKPEYRDYKGDTKWRNAKGQGDSLVYINSTGRNDIIKAKVARDTNYIYFYVETADTLTPKTDPKWMRLWIDTDRNKATGWEGYDYVINRINPGDSAVVERSVNNSWKWVKAGSAEYKINGKVLQIKVNRSVLGLDGKQLNFEFKWSDNCQNDGNIMDFYVNGDAAPDGRFNYVY